MAVIRDLEELESSVFGKDFQGSGTGVNGILDQLL